MRSRIFLCHRPVMWTRDGTVLFCPPKKSLQILTIISVVGVSIASGTLGGPPRRTSPSSSSLTSRGSAARSRAGSTQSTMNSDRNRSRRDRTFVGNECAVCEEPLEHTLRGERILQFSCSHVSHEACFYEFIKEFESQYCPTCNAPLHLDSRRGGNVLDIGKHINRPLLTPLSPSPTLPSTGLRLHVNADKLGPL